MTIEISYVTPPHRNVKSVKARCMEKSTDLIQVGFHGDCVTFNVLEGVQGASVVLNKDDAQAIAQAILNSTKHN